MTPKEKAIELIDKYKPFVYCYMGSGMLSNTYDEDVILNMSKQCALIAVDEIVKECYNWNGSDNVQWETKRFDYWNEVKQEIEKL
jgi:hypothetical protein